MIIRISADSNIHQIPFPNDRDVDSLFRELRRMVGIHCEVFSFVMPERLYSELHASKEMRLKEGRILMICDMDARFRNLPMNKVGSYLNEFDRGGGKICGDILIICQRRTRRGWEYTGLNARQINILYPQLKQLAEIFQ